VPIIVRDINSRPIKGVTSQDLVAKVNGKLVNIVSVAVDSRPRRAVILLDTSGSMRGDSDHWKLPLDVAMHVARSVSSNTRLAFLTFDDAVHNVIDFSGDNSAVLGQLNRMSDGEAFSRKDIQGHTALYDAVYYGLQLLKNSSFADLLFVISDGDDNKSSLKLEALERILIGSGVRLFAVRMRDLTNLPRARRLDEMGSPRVLAEIAEKTGGEVFGPVGFRLGGYIHFAFSNYNYSAKTKVEDALIWFYEGMLQSQALEIQLPAAIPTKEFLEVKLSKEAARRWKGATLSYARKLLPCGALAERLSAH
jgi:VWFA-related protein